MIDPSLQPYLDHWARLWADVPADASVALRRATLERLAEETRRPLPDGVTTEVVHAPGDGREVRVRLFRPAGGPPTPALVYMHGGGWMQGSPETHAEIAAAIAARAGFTVLSVDYALAPEHPFPAAVRDCEAVLRWTFANAAALNVRPEAVAVGGDSAGANLAAAMTLLFRGSSPRLVAQVLFYPPVDFRHDRPSVRENADGPIITAAGLPRVAALYAPDPADRVNPLAAPFEADDLGGLPPAFVAVAEHDPLRDEGRDYARRLAEAGGAVELHEGRGLFHGYLRAISEAAIARAPLDAACDWLAARARDA